MENVNTEENPFELEVELKSTGLADSNLIAGESGYAAAMSENKAIQGMPVELDYISGTIEKAVIKFNLKDTLTEIAAQDTVKESQLERYHIFRYDTEYNFLYPVNTIEDGNTIYTETDKLGTYCVMDLVEWDKAIQAESIPEPVPMRAAASGNFQLEQDEFVLPSFPEEVLTPEEQEIKVAEAERLIQAAMDEMYASEMQKESVGRSLYATPVSSKKIDIVIAVDSTGLMARTFLD